MENLSPSPSYEKHLVDQNESSAILLTEKNKTVKVIGIDKIRNLFEEGCIKQILNIADAPGIDTVVLGADGHQGYGCPVGSVFSSKEMIYPNAVGPDVNCSMSFLQFEIPQDALKDKKLRRALIVAIEERIPTGPGNHVGKKARKYNTGDLKEIALYGAAPHILEFLGIKEDWANYCEDASHGDPDELCYHLEDRFNQIPNLGEKLQQLGGVGGGNHFLECNIVRVQDGAKDIADAFGLVDGNIGFLSHFGSRGFGYTLTSGTKGWPGQFKTLAKKFKQWHIPFPGEDDHNVYIPIETKECSDYLNDMSMAANFAIVNHLLVNNYVLEAFKEVMGSSINAKFVYHIAHNIIKKEVVNGELTFVHRKGATRALPAKHFELKNSVFYDTGHPILLPGNPVEGSTIMVGQPGSANSLNSVNHGAGRIMGRNQAKKTFNQDQINSLMNEKDILTNCRNYPIDESPFAYKNYSDVIKSVEMAGLAKITAKLKPIMNIKDNDQNKENSA